MMKLFRYEQIKDKLSQKSFHGTTQSFKDVGHQFSDTSIETLRSIHAQIVQNKMKRTLASHQKPQAVKEFLRRYHSRIKGNERKPVLINIAEEADMSPALLARIVLENHLQERADGDEEPHKVLKSEVTRLMKEPHLIEDGALSIQVQLCNLKDPCYGPYVEAIKQSVGIEKEVFLINKLKEYRFDFMTEDDMRVKGYDKTPDVKLEVPFAWNGNVINWIESKASFGDEKSHNQYIKDQYFSYINRFGSGLVIYWFGFIDELAEACKQHGIHLSDRLPEEIEIVRFDPYPLKWDPEEEEPE
ncbi:CDAN1-interacting nuclease 1-like [Apostichopus japonicus]|uniref:CDAN1-interacting nuclease 1-like n=1 Tax=Stichopus japonicus TaxID=307972 RepID=UPI003AB1E235